MMKRGLVFFVWAALFPAGGWAAEEAVYLPAREFAAAAEREIDAAEKSIHLYLYLFSYQASRPDSPTGRLGRALFRARKRGVRVEATLNDGYAPGDPAFALRNRAAVEFLSAGGIDVFLSTGPTLHAKTLVIDDKVVLLGSSNWSASAFNENAEGNALIRSPRAARDALADFASVRRRPAPTAALGAIPIPAAFLEAGGPMDRMVRDAGKHSLDAALLLLRMKARAGTSSFEIGIATFTRALGFSDKWPTSNRWLTRRTLRRLRDDYGFIRLEEKEDGLADVFLPDEPGPEILLPSDYFDLGWNRRLSFSAKVFCLVSLYQSANSHMSPRWRLSQNTLAQRHGISPRNLYRGTWELRRAGLLEAEYSPFSTGDDPRAPTIYTPLPFYDPAALAERFAALEKAHGGPALSRAREIAALVYNDADAAAAEKLIAFEKKLGRENMEKAVDVIRTKKADNPRRTTGYLFAILERMEREKENPDIPVKE